jgi:two-component system NtrC family response regulator
VGATRELNAPGLAEVVGFARRVSGFPATPVMLVAETGSPSAAIARIVHGGPSGESSRPWVHLACEGRPEEAIELDLFGRPRGRDNRTGAAVDRARGGTLFIDSILCLSPSCQTRLLAHLTRLDAEDGMALRVVAATSVDLRAAVRQRRLRADLVRRLSAITIAIPPLRRRLGDIESLASQVAHDSARSLDKPFQGFSPGALDRLRSHSFPENEEELDRTIRRATVMATGPTIEEAAIQFESPPLRVAELFVGDAVASFHEDNGRPPTLAEIERAYLVWALGHTNVNRTAAARLLGISYPTIAKKIVEYDIDITSLGE